MPPLVHPFIKYIGPTYALQELLYGLVMALGTISTVSLALGLEPSSRHTLVLAALGVNTTWGLADMIMYIVTKNFDRLRHRRLVDALQRYPEEDWPLDAIEEDLEETIVGTLDQADQERIYLDVLDSGSRAIGRQPRYSAGHFYGGMSCLIITFTSALVVILPLLFIEPLEIALRTASVLAMLFLFLTGYIWAPYAGLNGVKTGLIMMGVGGLITLATLVLGG